MYGFPKRSAPIYIQRPFLGFDALSIPGCRLWLAPSKVGFVNYDSSGLRGVVKDGSPDARSFSVYTPVVYNPVTKKVAVYSSSNSGTALQTSWSILGGSQPRTLFFVGYCNNNGTVSTKQLLFGYTGCRVVVVSNNNIYVNTGSGDVLIATNASSTLSVFCLTAGSSGLYFYINGTQVYQNTSWSSTTSAGNTFTVSGAAGAYSIYTYLHELIVYDTQLSASDVAYVSSVLGREYGIF